MAEFVQENSWKKQDREQSDRQLRIACDDHKHRLNLAMQKPLEKDQRQEHQDKPEKTSELHGLFHRGAGNGNEIVHFQTCAAHQRAVNLRLGKKPGRIGACH